MAIRRLKYCLSTATDHKTGKTIAAVNLFYTTDTGVDIDIGKIEQTKPTPTFVIAGTTRNARLPFLDLARIIKVMSVFDIVIAQLKMREAYEQTGRLDQLKFGDHTSN